MEDVLERKLRKVATNKLNRVKNDKHRSILGHVTTRLHENKKVVGGGIILGLTIHCILYCWRSRNPFLLIIAQLLEPGREPMGEFSLS